MKYCGEVALITGAGSGLGQATAVLLARDGLKVGLLGRTREDLEETAATIADHGGDSLVLVADISQVDEMKTAVGQLVDKWGRLDYLFANAGINGVWAPIEELDPEEWDKTINVNLRGTFLTVKYCVPHLKKQGGSVVITASVNGTRIFSNTGATAYSTTKAGQVAMAKMLALELAQNKVRVNVICPGAIDTAIDENTDDQGTETVREPVSYPEGRIPLTDGEPGSSEQVGHLVRFLFSDYSAHITGTELWIDGAESLLQG